MKEIIEEMLAGTRPEKDIRAASRGKHLGDLPDSLRPDLMTLRPAAVLVPLVDHPSGLTVLLTRRTDTLPEHAGQIAFPGGREEPVDSGPLDCALRETEEEIGLPRHFVRPVGYLPQYITITGYSVIPVVGFVQPGFTPRPDPTEVAEIFEVPLDFILDAANHRRESRRYRDTEVSYYIIDWRQSGRDYRIWGATAAMLVDFAEMISGHRARASSL
ncbi:MAG TPA: CoA pyrophosphatase [Gammaproteobacteria bacterium]